MLFFVREMRTLAEEISAKSKGRVILGRADIKRFDGT